jgi:hypothetical protein
MYFFSLQISSFFEKEFVAGISLACDSFSNMMEGASSFGNMAIVTSI